MKYLITVRQGSTKIARQIEVDSLQTTVADVIEEAAHQERVRVLLAKMKASGVKDIRYFWFPEMQPKPAPPPPKPEPVAFETLINMCMV